jgi:hypothetical protein
MTQSKREKGKELEYLVAHYLLPIDKYARPSKASGASTEIGDIYNNFFFIECKNHDKNNLIIDMGIWRHLINQIPIVSKKIPLLIQKNNEEKIFVSLDIKDFFNLLYRAYKKEEE